MNKRKHLVALAISLLAAACTGEAPQHEARVATAAAPAPQRAGQPVDPLKTAGHIAAARVAAITGNQEGVRRNMEAMTEDMRRAMKLPDASRSEEHTSELQSLMRISYAVFCLKKKTYNN